MIEYNNETKKIKCECYIKIKLPLLSEIVIDKDKFKDSFKNIKDIFNLKILKCYNILFTKEGIISNKGSYIIIFILFIYLILCFVFFIKGYNSLIKKINSLFILRNIKDIKSINKYVFSPENPPIKNNLTKFKKNKKILNVIIINNKNKINAKLINEKIKDAPPKKIIKKKRAMSYSINSQLLYSDITLYKKKYKLKKNNEKQGNILFNNNNNNENSNNSISKITQNKKNLDKYNLNDYEFNSLSYEDAFIYDKRTFFYYYCSLIRTKHILLFAIIRSNDYNSQIIKFCIFIFSFSLYYTINALFFTEKIFHLIYIEGGNLNFIYQIPQILLSSIISTVIITIIKSISLSEKNILKLKEDIVMEKINLDAKGVLECLKIKFIFFFIISFLFLIFFWYYLACFGAVYKNTQLYLLKDTSIGFALSLMYPFIIYLIPGIFRIYSLKQDTKCKKCLYITSKIIQFY